MDLQFMKRSRVQRVSAPHIGGVSMAMAGPTGFGLDGRATICTEVRNSNPSGVRRSNRVSQWICRMMALFAVLFNESIRMVAYLISLFNRLKLNTSLTHCFLLLVALIVSPNILADTYIYNGIKYNYYGSTGRAEVASNQHFAGDAVIPESIKILGREYPVEALANYAFSGCTGLTSISLPESLKEIRLSAFEGCTGLTNITLPKSLRKIGVRAFYDCEELASIQMFSEYLTEIHDGAFCGCNALRRIDVNEGNMSFTSNDGVLFNKDSSQIVLFPPGREGSYSIPETVTAIGGVAFQDVNLMSITLPESIRSVEAGAFGDATCENIIVKAILDDASLRYLTGRLSGTIITNIHNVKLSPYGCVLSAKDAEFKGGVHLYDMSVEIQGYNPYLKGFQFKTVPNPYWDSSLTTEAVLSAGEGWSLPSMTAEGVYFVNGLDIDTTYELCWNWSYKTVPGETVEYRMSMVTQKPWLSWDCHTTQSTVTIASMSVSEDITCNYDGRMAVTYTHWNHAIEENVTEEFEYCGQEFTLRNFPPDFPVELGLCVYYDGIRYDIGSRKVRTQPLNPVVNITRSGPTSVELEGSYIEGDAVVSWMGINGNEGRTNTLTGLSPNGQYSATFVIVSCGQTYSSESLSFVTDPLEFVTLEPQGVSSSCAIVAAETNISELETNAGFQWKKYDAPESLKPSEGYAAIYNGMLEGYIRNLNSTSYYNVRPFYKDEDGQYYYGEWVTFDPSDFSFFEPRVHTYPAEEVGGTSAIMRGYVLGGTDEIIGQGFEYWEVGTQTSERRNAQSTGIMCVEGFGQVMRVVVDSLKEGTRYGFRTYAHTVVGKTYGEEQTFTTTGTADVWVITDDSTPDPVGYFDLCGRRYDVPRPGFNIVVYSDGTSRKFIRQ